MLPEARPGLVEMWVFLHGREHKAFATAAIQYGTILHQALAWGLTYRVTSNNYAQSVILGSSEALRPLIEWISADGLCWSSFGFQVDSQEDRAKMEAIKAAFPDVVGRIHGPPAVWS